MILRLLPVVPGRTWSCLLDNRKKVALATQKLAEDPLGLPVLVDVRDIERRAASGDVRLEDRPGTRQASCARSRAEVGRAEHVLRKPQTGPSSKSLITHEGLPGRGLWGTVMNGTIKNEWSFFYAQSKP